MRNPFRGIALLIFGLLLVMAAIALLLGVHK